MNMSEIGKDFARGVAEELHKPYRDGYDFPEPDWADEDIPDDEIDDDEDVEVDDE